MSNKNPDDKLDILAPIRFSALSESGREPIVTIRYDGKVEVNPKYTVDEAARAFWDAVIKLSDAWRRVT